LKILRTMGRERERLSIAGRPTRLTILPEKMPQRQGAFLMPTT